jgi:hypothetical protein
MSSVKYKEKYLKYKTKYLNLFNNLKGGARFGLLEEPHMNSEIWTNIIEYSTDCRQIISFARSGKWLKDIIVENIIGIIHKFIKSIPVDTINTRAFWVNIFGQYINLDANAEEYINLLLDATMTKDVLYNLFEETCIKYKLYKFLINEVKLENGQAEDLIEQGFSMQHYNAINEVLNHPIFSQGIKDISQAFKLIVYEDEDNFEYFIQNFDLNFIGERPSWGHLIKDDFIFDSSFTLEDSIKLVIDFKKEKLFSLFEEIRTSVSPSIQQIVSIFNGIDKVNRFDKTESKEPIYQMIIRNNLYFLIKLYWDKANEGLDISDEQKVINTINYTNSIVNRR